ncbi:MAG: hypothetical protein ACOC6O_02370 [Chloroflexota bacterium]
MATDLKPVHEYIRAIEKELARGIATEQNYVPDFVDRYCFIMLQYEKVLSDC